MYIWSLSVVQILVTNGETDQGVFCYVNWVTFRMPWNHLRMGAGCQGNELCDWRTGTFSTTLWPPGGGERLEVESIANGQWFDHCLRNEASMKSQKDRIQTVSGLVDRWKFQKRGTLREHGSSTPFPIPCRKHLFQLAVPEYISFYNKRVI